MNTMSHLVLSNCESETCGQNECTARALVGTDGSRAANKTTTKNTEETPSNKRKTGEALGGRKQRRKKKTSTAALDSAVSGDSQSRGACLPEMLVTSWQLMHQ